MFMKDSVLEALRIDEKSNSSSIVNFCRKFISGGVPRFVFGRNEYADSIASKIDIDGFIDEFTSDVCYLGKPIVKLNDIPVGSLVVSVVIGRPFVAAARLSANAINFVDYFAFKRYSELDVLPVKFWDRFAEDFIFNREKYNWIYRILADGESKRQFEKIVNFRLSHELKHMQGFSDLQNRQYFEEFLNLRVEGETFLDIGCFDGFTSMDFAKRCKGYSAIHAFEPESGNMEVVQASLLGMREVYFHQYGLSNFAGNLRFSANGSSSKISDEGELVIRVERLDDKSLGSFSFLKMDIEGGECFALEGAANSISNYRPRLAISVYHRFDDLWRIPEQVLSYHCDYKIYLRHYTEGVDETVMFFIPA